MKKGVRSYGTRIISFPFLFIGCIFLCTPNVNLFDLLPDAVGYLLLMLAIRRAGDVFPHFDAAYENFRRLLWISLAKIPASLVMMYITGTNLQERGIITVFAISFAVLEWIFAFPAFRSLFESFIYLGEREGVMCALRTKSGKSADTLSILSMIFLIVKGACSFLPEIVFLSTFEYNGSLDPGAINPVVFYPFLAIVGAILALILGIVWVVSLCSYFNFLKTDEEMQELLETKAQALTPELQALDEKRRQRSFLFLLTAGFIFAVDPLIGNRDLLPNAFAALSFFFAFTFFTKSSITRHGKIFSLLYLVVSVIENVFSASFFAKFKLVDVAFRDAALLRYAPVVLLRLVESGLFLITLLSAMRLLRDFIQTHTGKNLRPENMILRQGLQDELVSRTKKLSIFAALYALLRPVSAILMAVTTRHVITEKEANQFYSEGTVVYSSLFSWLWMLLLAVGIFVAAYAFSLMREVRREATLEKPDFSQE